MARGEKSAVNIGVCSEHFRPQKYERRDPHPNHPFTLTPKPCPWCAAVYLLGVAGFISYIIFS